MAEKVRECCTMLQQQQQLLELDLMPSSQQSPVAVAAQRQHTNSDKDYVNMATDFAYQTGKIDGADVG